MFIPIYHITSNSVRYMQKKSQFELRQLIKFCCGHNCKCGVFSNSDTKGLLHLRSLVFYLINCQHRMKVGFLCCCSHCSGHVGVVMCVSLGNAKCLIRAVVHVCEAVGQSLFFWRLFVTTYIQTLKQHHYYLYLIKCLSCPYLYNYIPV